PRHIHRCRVCGREYRSGYLDPKRMQARCIAATGGSFAPPIPHEGPGTELAVIFTELGITAKQSCQCAARMAEMNRLGIEGCRRARTLLLTWLEEAYDSSSYLERARAFSWALWQGKPKSLAGL